MDIGSQAFWIALVQIIGVNIVLSGDNAVVIALAARGLPPEQQKRAVAWGSGAAVVMRIVLTIVAVELLRLPYLKLGGAVLLLWIAVKLLVPEDDADGHGAAANKGMAAAVKTILLADLVMSLDNVIAVAAAAKGNLLLLIVGLAVSIPLVVFASRLLLGLMERYPAIITVGAALLGWVAGEMAIGDPVVKPWVDAQAPWLHYGAPALAAVAVLVMGKLIAARAATARPTPAPSAVPRTDQLRRVLLAFDGSAGAAGALEHALALCASLREPQRLEWHLINVQRPFSGDVASFVAAGSLSDYHRERSDQALLPARERLRAAGKAFEEHRRVGDPGPTIAEVARTQACDLIVIGSRGLGSHTAG